MSKKKEYFNIIAQVVQKFLNKKLQKAYEDTYVRCLANYLADLNKVEYTMLRVKPKALENNKIQKHFQPLYNIINTNYNKVLGEAMAIGVNLGIYHQILEMLAMLDIPKLTDLVTEESRVGNPIQSFSTSNFLEVFKQENDIAEFNESGGTGRQNRRVEDARQRYRNLQQRLDDLGYPVNSNIISRMSLKQRQRFYEGIDEISNYTNKAELAKSNYLKSNYLERRRRALTFEYAQSTNDRIMSRLSNYLSTNASTLNQFESYGNDTEKMYRYIKGLIRRDPASLLESHSMGTKTTRVIRTELATGYTVGKMSGFMAPEDINKRFIWRADFEGLNTCKYCLAMHSRAEFGESFTAGEIMQMTMNPRAVGGFAGAPRQTAWKNLITPFIPGHPNCSCYWKYTGINPTGAGLVGGAGEIPPVPSINTMPPESGVEQAVRNEVDTAKGVVVAGGFLLTVAGAFAAMQKSVEFAAVMAKELPAITPKATSIASEITTPPPKTEEAVITILKSIGEVKAPVNPKLQKEITQTLVSGALRAFV